MRRIELFAPWPEDRASRPRYFDTIQQLIYSDGEISIPLNAIEGRTLDQKKRSILLATGLADLFVSLWVGPTSVHLRKMPRERVRTWCKYPDLC